MIRLDGFKEFGKKLSDLPKNIQVKADAIVKDSASEWARNSKRAAPKDQGKLAGQIQAVSVAPGVSEVVSPVDYSPFVEWGTKTRVRVPAELQAYAQQFKGAKGGDAKKFIYDWCKRKGIDKRYWFLVYKSVMVKGITPHPFFFIQRPIIEPKFKDRLSKIF